MARILALNNYDLESTRREVLAGRVPDHLLYGINHFERAGHSVEVVPFRRSRQWQLATDALQRFPVPLGDLDQQRAALGLARRADIIYCPSQNVAQLLGYMRFARLLGRPIVWVVHHPFDTGRLRALRRPAIRALLRGIDAYPALSAPVAQDLTRVAGSDERASVVSLGPDADWYEPVAGAGSGVIATGRTNRDFETFVRGASEAGVEAWVVGSGMTHRELMQQYARARAVAIPLKVQWPWPMNGLHTLMDAIGMGKPVIVTRNPWLDIDVERFGIGMWVAPGDARGWREAIRWMEDHPDEAFAMGRRARALVDDHGRTSAAFAQKIMDVFERVLAR